MRESITYKVCMAEAICSESGMVIWTVTKTHWILCDPAWFLQSEIMQGQTRKEEACHKSGGAAAK